MASERVTVQVESNLGEDGPLSVAATLHQFLDAFEFLAAAVEQEEGGGTIRWRLVSMSKNSPATATAEAYSTDPTVAVAPILFQGKRRFYSGVSDLDKGIVAPWIESHFTVAKDLLRRNLNGVGRTVFDLDGELPQTVVVERVARQWLKSIERFESDKEAEVVDRTHSEFGSIDANVAQAATYKGSPALYVRERLTGKTIPAVLTEQAAKEAGTSHSWADAWDGKRVRVQGEIFYNAQGEICRVRATKVTDVVSPEVDLPALRSMNVTNGKSPQDHLNDLWGYDG